MESNIGEARDDYPFFVLLQFHIKKYCVRICGTNDPQSFFESLIFLCQNVWILKVRLVIQVFLFQNRKLFGLRLSETGGREINFS